MRVFIAVLILIFGIQSWTKADDISEFEIEGMSIGDSLLDYYSENEIKNSVKGTSYKSKKYTKIEFYKGSEFYDGFQFFFKKNDKKYIISALSAHLKYKHNIEDCFKKQDEIIEEVSILFKNIKNYRKTINHNADKSGKSKIHAHFFDFNSGANVRIDCNDYSKKIYKKYKWVDNLRVGLMSSEFREWLNNEAWK